MTLRGYDEWKTTEPEEGDVIDEPAHWQCDVCGKHGTPDDLVLLTSGNLSRGTLRAHMFCREHDPRRRVQP